jgi:hypothetical protein
MLLPAVSVLCTVFAQPIALLRWAAALWFAAALQALETCLRLTSALGLWVPRADTQPDQRLLFPPAGGAAAAAGDGDAAGRAEAWVTPLLELPVVRQAELLRERRVRSTQLVAAYAARIRALHFALNAVVRPRGPARLPRLPPALRGRPP